MLATIHDERYDIFSFLVSMIHTPKLPEGIKPAEYYTGLAIVGVNDVDGNGLYGGVALSHKEKEVIHAALVGERVQVGDWVWCNLYEQHQKE